MSRAWLIRLEGFADPPLPELRRRFRFSASIASPPPELAVGDEVVGWVPRSAGRGSRVVAVGVAEVVGGPAPVILEAVGPALRAKWETALLVSEGLRDLVGDSQACREIDSALVAELISLDAAKPVASRYSGASSFYVDPKFKPRSPKPRSPRFGPSQPFIPGRGKNW